MSFIALKRGFEMDFPKVEGISTASAKITFLALCNFASDDGEAFPTWETLARVTCLDRKSIAKALRALCVSGLIFDTGKKTGKFGRVSIYKVCIDCTSDSTKCGTIEQNDSTKNGTIESVDSTKCGTIDTQNDDSIVPNTERSDSTTFGTHNLSIGTNTLSASHEKNDVAKRPHKLPDGWTPNERAIRIISEKKFDYDFVMADFFAYWQGPKAKGGGLKVNWDQTFLNYLKLYRQPTTNQKQPQPEKKAPLNARNRIQR